LVRQEEGLQFYTKLRNTNVTKILAKRALLGECYRYPLAQIDNRPTTMCTWPENSLIALQQIAKRTNTSLDKISQQWATEMAINPTINIEDFSKKHKYPCTVIKANPSSIFEITPITNILVRPQKIPCESQLPVIFNGNGILYDHDGYPLPKQYQTKLPRYHSQSNLQHLTETNTLENLMIKDRMERQEVQFVQSYATLEENQQLLANKTAKNALKEVKDFKSLAQLSYQLSFQVQSNQMEEKQLQKAIEKDHQELYLFSQNMEHGNG